MIDYFHKKYKRLSKSSKSSKSSTTPDTTQEPDQKNSSVYTSAINVFSGAQSSFKKMFSSS